MEESDSSARDARGWIEDADSLLTPRGVVVSRQGKECSWRSKVWDAKAMKAETVLMFSYSWPIVLKMALHQLQVVIVIAFVNADTTTASNSRDVLGGIGVGVMVVNATGWYMIMGLASGLETMASQLYGQGRLQSLGLALQAAIVVISLFAVPVAWIWWNLQELLELLGFEGEQGHVACNFARSNCCALPSEKSILSPRAICNALGLWLMASNSCNFLTR